MVSLSFRVQCISISFYIADQCYLQECRNRIVFFILTCFSSHQLLRFPEFPRKHTPSPPRCRTLSSWCEEQVDTDEQQTRDRLCKRGWGGGGWRMGWWALCLLMTSVLHWKWHTGAFKLMWLPSTFRFFYRAPSLPWGFFIFAGPSSLWLPSILETDAP